MDTGICIAMFFIGCIVGFWVCVWKVAGLHIGMLKIAHSDESSRPYMFVDLDVPVEMFESKRFVLMKVKPEYYSSQD